MVVGRVSLFAGSSAHCCLVAWMAPHISAALGFAGARAKRNKTYFSLKHQSWCLRGPLWCSWQDASSPVRHSRVGMSEEGLQKDLVVGSDDVTWIHLCPDPFLWGIKCKKSVKDVSTVVIWVILPQCPLSFPSDLQCKELVTGLLAQNMSGCFIFVEALSAF